MITSSEIGLGLKLAETLSKLMSSDLNADLIKALRFLRFDEDGILRTINRLIAGEEISTQHWADQLPRFNDLEWKVQESCNRIAFEALEGSNAVSRFDRQELDTIRYKKLNVRKSVQDALNNKWHTKDYTIAELKKLRAEIHKLNKIIDEAEDKFVRRR